MGTKGKRERHEDDENEEPQVKASPATKKAEKGWNYTAIFLMMLFILPGFIAVVMQVLTKI